MARKNSAHLCWTELWQAWDFNRLLFACFGNMCTTVNPLVESLIEERALLEVPSTADFPSSSDVPPFQCSCHLNLDQYYLRLHLRFCTLALLTPTAFSNIPCAYPTSSVASVVHSSIQMAFCPNTDEEHISLSNYLSSDDQQWDRSDEGG